MLRDHFRVWGINNKNARVKRERQNYDSEAVGRVVRSRRARRNVGAGQQVTDANLKQLTLEDQLRSTNECLLATSHSSTPNYVEPEDTLYARRQSITAFVSRYGNAELAMAFCGPGELPSPLRTLEGEPFAMRTLKATVDFYTNFRETHKVLTFRGVESSPMIELTSELSHALQAVNKYSIDPAWPLLRKACLKVESRLRVEHPDSLVFLLKFLVHIKTTEDNGAAGRVCYHLANMSARKLGEEHPISLICSAARSGSMSPELCDKLFRIFQDRPVSHPRNEAIRDRRKIRALYSHVLMYQSRFPEADAVLVDLEVAQSNPCDKVGFLRQLADSKRRQKDTRAAEQALDAAWQILQSQGTEATSRGASIKDAFASVYEDAGDINACVHALRSALRCQKNPPKPEKMRRVAWLDSILRKQGKFVESSTLRQDHPDVFE